jgi:hypothetical protein
MSKITIGLAIVVALALVSFGLVAAARPRPEAPHLVSMQESAGALLADGGIMQARGQAMLEEGQRVADQNLIAEGQHWLLDGQDLTQRAHWLAMDPVAPANLATSPAELSRQGAWGRPHWKCAGDVARPEHSTQRIGSQALRSDGQAMQAEGRAMADHGRVMADQVETMVALHNVDASTLAALRRAARTMEMVGSHLSDNGQAMIDCAERMRRSLGYL